MERTNEIAWICCGHISSRNPVVLHSLPPTSLIWQGWSWGGGEIGGSSYRGRTSGNMTTQSCLMSPSCVFFPTYSNDGSHIMKTKSLFIASVISKKYIKTLVFIYWDHIMSWSEMRHPWSEMIKNIISPWVRVGEAPHILRSQAPVMKKHCFIHCPNRWTWPQPIMWWCSNRTWFGGWMNFTVVFVLNSFSQSWKWKMAVFER